MHTAITRIRELEEELNDTRESYLRRAGWAYTCHTPGSYWMWTKRIEHTTVSPVSGTTTAQYDALVDLKTAVRLQEAMDAKFVEDDEG